MPADCPPDGVSESEGEFFRLILFDAVDERAFLSMRELQPKRKVPPHRTECQACGISLYEDKAGAEGLRLANPATFKNARIARGTLDASMGLMQATPCVPNDTHTTFWPFAGATPWLAFAIIEEVERE